MKRFVCIVAIMSMWASAIAKPALLTLEACHRMADSANIQTAIDRENALAAHYSREAALARFFPQVSANGAYAWNSRHAYALPDNMPTQFGSMGLDGLHFNNPTMQQLGEWFPNTKQQINTWAGAAYGDLYKQFDLDFTHVLVGQVGVVQPIWVGGRIMNTYRITRSLERMSTLKARKNQADLMVEVDEAYWRVLSVTQKLALANRYAGLLRQLDQEVEAAQAEGLATGADVLQVKVALSEAESQLAQAEDGLLLSKMALCQLIGLPLHEDIHIDTTFTDEPLLSLPDIDMTQVKQNRAELQLLDEMQHVADAGVGLAAAGLQPNIVAQASYIVTNPNLTNGFKNNFAGFFTAGVAVNIPIAHASDILAYKAARHKARTVQLQREEAEQKIELQVTQSAQKVVEANHRLIRAKQTLAHNEEILRYARESYEEGVVTASDLMKAQTAWHKAYSDKIDAAIALRMAQMTYQQHTGTLTNR